MKSSPKEPKVTPSYCLIFFPKTFGFTSLQSKAAKNVHFRTCKFFLGKNAFEK